MRTKISAGLLAMVSMFMIVAMSWMPSASAWEDEGTATVDELHYWSQPIEFFSGDYLIVSFTIDVQNDVYIDVMLLNEENFNKYANEQPFGYYTAGTDFSTISTSAGPITFYTHDNYYIVVDNTYEPDEGTDPVSNGINEYCTFYHKISANAYFDDTGEDYQPYVNDDDDDDALTTAEVMCGLMIFGVIIIIIIVIVIFVKRKGGQTQPYYPQQQQELSLQSPPMDPYHRDQQPPPPPDYQPPQQP